MKIKQSDAERLIAYVAEPESEKLQWNDYKNGTYQIISKVAYLIGVDKRHFEAEHESPQMSWYDELSQNKNARIIRNLCRLRTAIEQNYSTISSLMYYDVKNLGTLPKYIPPDALLELSSDGINIEKPSYKLNQYIININKHISNRINNVKELFPIWLNWEYIRQLFIMPNGAKEEGIKSAASEYYQAKNSYPYQVYINWAGRNQGNILFNDRKFVVLLYEAHNDMFSDMSKVTDAGFITKSGIYDFLESSERCCIVVDCENSDAYKLYATLKNLDQERLLDRVSKIILFDDVHTTSAWSLLDEFMEIPIEHITIERILEHKSLVDIRLSAGVCMEYYENYVDSFILASSDSDYWALISSIPKIKFLVLIENEKCSGATKRALLTQGIKYCYIDDFSTGNSGELKEAVILSEVKKALDEAIHINIHEVVEAAFINSRAELSPAERRQFLNRYIRQMKLVIEKDGSLRIQLGK